MRKGTCKHYNGDYHNKMCAAGVCYRDVTTNPDSIDGRAYRKPCVNWDVFKLSSGNELSPGQREHWERHGHCDKYQEPTAEEIAAYEAETQAAVKRFTLAIPVMAKVKREHQGQDWKGVEVCPVCQGKLYTTHAAFNGHVWGMCETDGCLSWVE